MLSQFRGHCVTLCSITMTIGPVMSNIVQKLFLFRTVPKWHPQCIVRHGGSKSCQNFPDVVGLKLADMDEFFFFQKNRKIVLGRKWAS